MAYFDNDIEFQGDINPVLRCASAGRSAKDAKTGLQLKLWMIPVVVWWIVMAV